MKLSHQSSNLSKRAASLGCLSRVKMPLLLPATNICFVPRPWCLSSPPSWLLTTDSSKLATIYTDSDLSTCAASLGCRSRVKTPFLLPATLLGSCFVMKSAKFQMCSPMNQPSARARSNALNVSIISSTCTCQLEWQHRTGHVTRGTWYSSVKTMEGSMCRPATVSAPYSVSMTGLPGTRDTADSVPASRCPAHLGPASSWRGRSRASGR